MAALGRPTTVAGVDATGAGITARRTAIGMSVSALAKRAGVDRGSLAALEEGRTVRDTTVAAVIRTLADLEHEMGMDEPEPPRPAEPHLIEFEVTGDFGVRVVVKGPIQDAREIEESVARLVRDLTPKD
jgi:transcriptional regulator with XRE-family HTH domain